MSKPATLCQLIDRLDKAIGRLFNVCSLKLKNTPEFADVADAACALYQARDLIAGSAGSGDFVQQVDAYRALLAEQGDHVDRSQAIVRLVEFALEHVNVVEETVEPGDRAAAAKFFAAGAAPQPFLGPATFRPHLDLSGRSILVCQRIENPRRIPASLPELEACEQCDAPLLVDVRCKLVATKPGKRLLILCQTCADAHPAIPK